MLINKNQHHAKSLQQWKVNYFEDNLQKKRINWQQSATVTKKELAPILKSLQAWQLAESSDGKNLLKASSSYAERIGRSILY